MRLSIIIATTPKRRDLIKLLESIENQSYQPDEVLIVTDKNKSKSVARVLNNSFLSKEKLRLVESAGIGLSHARNRGVEATTGDICCFIDDDVVLESLLKDCKCYYLRCNDWKWGDLIEKIV